VLEGISLRRCAKSIGVRVRVYTLLGDEIGMVHVPWPVSEGDVLELGGEGPISPLRVVELVETGRMSPSRHL
jgi:hypothetical protein